MNTPDFLGSESGTVVWTGKQTATVSDAGILAKLDECSGHITRTAKELRIRKARVVAVNRANGNQAKDKKQRSMLEAAEALVIHLCAMIERITIHNAQHAHHLGRLLGAAVDRYIALAEKAGCVGPPQPPERQQFDSTKLTRADILELIRQHDTMTGFVPGVDGLATGIPHGPQTGQYRATAIMHSGEPDQRAD